MPSAITGNGYAAPPKSSRDFLGLTATVVELETGEVRSLVRGRGTAITALLEIVDELDASEGDWRVRTISTPMTILGDLRAHGSGLIRRGPSPEERYLSAIGRLDLLEPR